MMPITTPIGGRRARRHGGRSALAALVLLTMASAPALAQVWKCRGSAASAVSFSDLPCPGGGELLTERRLQPNVIDGLRLPAAEPAAAAPDPGPPANDCPGGLELRNMETRANSRSLGEAEQAFMEDEIRRVRQCQRGQGRYTPSDWAISREAQAAQSSRSNAAAARRRAEGMHSAADPLEGQRIAANRREQERRPDLLVAPWPSPCWQGCQR